MMKPFLLPLMASGLLVACAGAAPPASGPPVAMANHDFGIDIGTLPAQKLAPGSCGLFLWSKAPQRRLVFFSDSRAPVARMMIDGRQSALERLAADGDMFRQSLVRQSFDAGGREIGLEFEVEQRPGLVDGAMVPRGTLRLADGTGREMVMPVGGLIACTGN